MYLHSIKNKIDLNFYYKSDCDFCSHYSNSSWQRARILVRKTCRVWIQSNNIAIHVEV